MPLWRFRLSNLVAKLEERKRRTPFFNLRVFLFFIALNVICYWIAMVSAFPDVAFGPEREH